ncbi:hypothetical protein CN485_20325 [Bacillus cereus]|nr:hypothetical protein CN485_20325 [Bacillus cereus]
MTFKTYELDVDLVNQISTKELRFSQGDENSAKLIMNLKNRGKELDLSLAKAVRITFEKPDGTIVYQEDCDPIDKMKGKYQIVLKTQTLAAVGNVLCQVRIIEENGKLDAEPFGFYVKKSLSGDEAVESSDQFPIIEQVLEAGKQLEGVDIPALVASKETAESALAKSTENTNQIGNLSKSVEENASFLGGDIKSLWEAPVQPARDTIISAADNKKYSKYLDLWDNLVSGNEEYITKTKLGRDQSGTYDIYKYVFEPKNYEKTIIVNCNIHGHETMGHLMFYQFMKLVVNDYMKSSQLNYIRNKVRVVTIPVQNPWGLENFTRGNSRQVNLNRNFDYLWDLNTETDKGAAPLSEAEAVITNNLLKDYKDAVIYLDLHNTESGMDYNYYAVVPKYLDIARDVIYKTIQAVSPIKNPNNNIQTSEQPVVANNGVANHGIQSAIIEWVPGTMSPASYDSTDMTYAVKFIGNLILQFLAHENIKLGAVGEATSSHVTFINRAKSTGTGWTKMGLLEIELSPNVDGIVLVNGTTMCKNTDDTAMSYIAPVITQSGNDLAATGTIVTQQDHSEVFAELGLKMGSLSYNRSMPVRAVGKDNGAVKVMLYMKTTAGVLSNERTRLEITFLPTNAAVSFKSYVTVGATGEIKQSYPDPVKMTNTNKLN